RSRRNFRTRPGFCKTSDPHDKLRIGAGESPQPLVWGGHSFFARRYSRACYFTQEASGTMLLDAEILEAIAKAPVEKRAISNLKTLNEASDYGSAFSRGLRIDLNGLVILLISGTASIDEHGKTVHVGDFRAQLHRTYQNITLLLQAEGATW